MKETNKELSEQWLKKARNDLITAKSVLEILDGPTDTPCFHSQQAIEKAFKAVLTTMSIRFERVHDLIPLYDAIVKYLPKISGLREDIAEISSYAVEIRYPIFSDEPSRKDAEKSLKIAENIVSHVENYITKLNDT